MAIGFLVCMAPDSHIAFLQQHPGLVHYYLDRNAEPELDAPVLLPEWWPDQPPQLLDAWCVNHRNTDLYHWILNGGPGLVTNAGAIFQSWHKPEHPSSFIKLDKYNERFAFHSSNIAELTELVSAVSVKSVLTAFVEWCKSQGKEWEHLDEYACEPFADEFKAFEALLREAAHKKYGIIW